MFKCQQLKQEGKSKAFTLIEMVTAMALAGILLLSLYAVFSSSYGTYQKNVARAEINQNARIAAERISRDLRQAGRMVTELPSTDTDMFNPPPSSILFQDGHDTSKLQYIKYSLDGNNLKRELIYYCFSCPDPVDPSTWVAWNAQDNLGNPPTEKSLEPPAIKADKITSLKFWGDKLITIQIAATSKFNSTITIETKVLGRNIQ